MRVPRFVLAIVLASTALIGPGALAASAADPAGLNGEADVSFCAYALTTERLTCEATPDSLAETLAGLEDFSPDVVVLIARLYDNANFDITNGYLDVYAGADCTVSKTGVDYQNPDLGVWKNRVSSFTSYGNCATKLWTGTSYTGTSYPGSGFQVSSSNVGTTMNDNAESAQFS